MISRQVTTATDATGKATHIGRVSLLSSHCPDEPGYVLDGRSTVAAANGDELYGVYDYDPFSESNEILVYFRWRDRTIRRILRRKGVDLLHHPGIEGRLRRPREHDCRDFMVPWTWWSTPARSISY